MAKPPGMVVSGGGEGDEQWRGDWGGQRGSMSGLTKKGGFGFVWWAEKQSRPKENKRSGLSVCGLGLVLVCN